MAKSHLKLVTPSTVKRTVTPKRRRNGDLRTREYLTEAEVERLMKAATCNRNGHRDATMILVAYRHGLRVSELVELRWDQVDFRTATLHVRRVKQRYNQWPSRMDAGAKPILGPTVMATLRQQIRGCALLASNADNSIVMTMRRWAAQGLCALALSDLWLSIRKWRCLSTSDLIRADVREYTLDAAQALADREGINDG
jgi:integrase-like protein